MREMYDYLEGHRIRNIGTAVWLQSSAKDGMNGVFRLPVGHRTDRFLICIISDGADALAQGWEHVSVRATQKRKGRWDDDTPSWDEMDFAKQVFWKDDEVVVQYHIHGSRKVNMHPYVLHLWRNKNAAFIQPPEIMV